MPVQISTRPVVEYDDGVQWVPEVQNVGGINFCKIQKWDRKFIRFAKASALNLAKAAESNIGIVDELCNLRNLACDQALIDLDQVSDGSAGGPLPRRRVRHRKASNNDILVLPSYVDISLPDIILPNGVMAGFTAKVLAEGVRSTTLFIEMSIEVLEYIRSAALHSPSSGRCWRKKNPNNRRNSSINDGSQDLPQGVNLRSRSRSPV